MAQYLKPDSALGYIEDTAEIECLKFNNLRHIVLGCMMGDFDENGAYVVSPEIIEELIAMEKYIVNAYDNIELCKSVLKLDRQITFMVTFEGNRATLSLIEKLNYEANYAINSGTYSNINEYVLDVVETNGEINRNVLYDRWNIKTNQGRIIDVFSADESVLAKYLGIVNRFKYLLQANKVMLQKEEEMEEVEAGYANDILDILKHYPKLNAAVMKAIQESLSEKKDAITIKKPYFAKTFNEVLDNAIAQNVGLLQEKDLDEFEKEKRNATVNFNLKRENLLELEHIKPNDEKQLSPNVLKLKVSDFASRSVQDVAEDYVAENRRVINIYSNEAESTDLISRVIARNSEREKLITTMVAMGVSALIGGPAGAVVEPAVAATVEVVSATKDDEKKPSPIKKPEVKKPDAKKPSPTKKPEATKPAATKPEAKKPATTKKPQKEAPKPQTNEENKRRKKKVSIYDEEEEESLYYGSTSGLATESPKGPKGTSVKLSILERINQAKAGLDAEQAKRINTTKGSSELSAQLEKERSITTPSISTEGETLKNHNSTRVNSDNIHTI